MLQVEQRINVTNRSNSFVNPLIEQQEEQIVGDQLDKIEKIRKEINKAFNRIEIVQHTTEMMRNLMLDLLDLAQMENQSFKINEEFFNLHEVIENSFRVIKHYAEKKFVKLICP